MRAVLLPILILALVAGGCARSTPLPGLHIDQDGRIARTTPVQLRARSEQVVAQDLVTQLGPEWEVAVEIAPDPSEDFTRDDQRHWYWNEIEVTVALSGVGEPPLDADAIGRIVGSRLAPHLRQPQALTVVVAR